MASAHQRKITNNGAVMHIFIDESGNSGLSLFDESQPFFYSLAISCSNDFEKKSKKSMDQLRKQALPGFPWVTGLRPAGDGGLSRRRRSR